MVASFGNTQLKIFLGLNNNNILSNQRSLRWYFFFHRCRSHNSDKIKYNNIRIENIKDMTDTPVTAEDLAEIIVELEKYRDRLVNETMETAKKAKLSKKATMAKLEPQLADIDSKLVQLREQQANLTENN